MAKFNTVRKISNVRKKPANIITKKPKLSNELVAFQLEKNQIVPRKNKYRKKMESDVRKIINEKT